MPEEMAFQVFVSMMQRYELRDLYKLGFENLTLRFYQVGLCAGWAMNFDRCWNGDRSQPRPHFFFIPPLCQTPV